MAQDVAAAYRDGLESGAIKPDAAQEKAVARLDALARELRDHRPEPPERIGFLARLGFGAAKAEPVDAPKGLYLEGGVGRGKSMVMDLFFDHVEVEPRIRTHFHDFMLGVHKRLHEKRKREGSQDDILTSLADEIASDAKLLCFDEFHVVNIADAMILGRLFTRLFDRGVVMVATSNWPPDRLYENGLQRNLFLPFIDLLKTKVEVVSLNGPVDYRRKRIERQDHYFAPDGPAARAKLEEAWGALTDDAAGDEKTIEVNGRRLIAPKAARGVAWYGFAALCDRPLGAADYLALAETFHTLILEGVPLLTPDKRNDARRFMTLIDALYERGALLIVAAEAQPDALYPEGDGAFEFQRTASRLLEMRAADYAEKAREKRAKGDFPTFESYALTSDLL